jgi:hypothetical protein
MKRKIICVFLVVVIALLITVPASAITFGEPDGGKHPNVGMLWAELPNDGPFVPVCSGTKVPAAVDYDIYLTAAHCLVWAPEGTTWFVTFDEETMDYSVNPPVVIASFIEAEGAVYHPGYGHDMADLHDLGVVLLPLDSTGDIDAAELPYKGQLDEMKAGHALKGQEFVAVGYGGTRQDKTGGPQAIYYEDSRQFSVGTYNALTKNWLKISMNPATDDGGTCYGDSGGPHFLGDSSLLVSITVTGDIPCRATDVTYRLDTESARSFLSDFVDLP